MIKPMKKRTYPAINSLMVDGEYNPADNSHELDAGEIVYFDPFKQEWVTLGGE